MCEVFLFIDKYIYLKKRRGYKNSSIDHNDKTNKIHTDYTTTKVRKQSQH